MKVHENVKRFARNYATLFIVFFTFQLLQMPVALLGFVTSYAFWELLKFCVDRWESNRHPMIRKILIRVAVCTTVSFLTFFECSNCCFLCSYDKLCRLCHHKLRSDSQPLLEQLQRDIDFCHGSLAQAWILRNPLPGHRLIVGIAVSGFVSLVIFVFVWLRKKRKRKAKEITDFTSMINEEDLDKEAGPRRFAYKDLVLATNRFSAQRKLGEGGFGAVYRGFLNEIDSVVAVKKLSGRSRQGKREFLTEVKIISKLRHRNLVQLIGWCNEKHEYLLVYEFMPNGSLDTHLFGKIPHLCWDVRYKVALGLASALLYLHEEWDRCVLHRDIKASNIMLDTNFNVKLGDFGLARLIDHEMGSHTTGLAGTFGYMAPENVMTGRASKESDIYSFGISILEIVTGRKSVEHSEEEIEAKSLVERVWDLYGRQQLMSAMDEKLGEEFNREQAECLGVVGLWCGHPDRNARPSIRQAFQVLNLESTWPELPQKMPVPTYHIWPTSLSISSSRGSVTFSSCQAGR